MVLLLHQNFTDMLGHRRFAQRFAVAASGKKVSIVLTLCVTPG